MLGLGMGLVIVRVRESVRVMEQLGFCLVGFW